MNRTIKDATVRRFYYETHDSLRTHLATFIDAYNFTKRLKSLRGLTPLPADLSALDRTAGTIQTQSHPPHAGTEHPPVRALHQQSEERPRAPLNIRRHRPPFRASALQGRTGPGAEDESLELAELRATADNESKPSGGRAGGVRNWQHMAKRAEETRV